MTTSAFRLSLRLPLLALAIGVLAACGSTPSAGESSSAAAADLAGTTWNLESYAGPDGATVPAVSAPRLAPLTFAADGSWSGSTGCNRINGTYTQDGSTLTMTPGPMTLMACDGAVAAQEAAIVAHLPEVASFTSGESLVLLSADGTPLLTYTPGMTGLAGTSWQATGINNGKDAVVSQAGTEKATITFGADGQASGSGGCNTFSGTYTVTAPDGLSFGPLAATEMACLDGDATAIEQAYFTALSEVTAYQLEADTLTLRDASGATQVAYRLAP
jgi:heat shock protein HslJ